VPGLVAHLFARQRWQLEEQRSGAGAESLDRRLHEFIERRLQVQESRVGVRRRTTLGANRRIRHQRRRLDDEAEVFRNLLRIARVVRGFQWLVETAIDADTAQQRVLRIRGQPEARELGLRVFAVPDETLPAGEAPRRSPEMNTARQQPASGGGRRRAWRVARWTADARPIPAWDLIRTAIRTGRHAGACRESTPAASVR
jgi:hypothetical protein